MCVYIYIHIYVYVYTYVYTYIYILMNAKVTEWRKRPTTVLICNTSQRYLYQSAIPFRVNDTFSYLTATHVDAT